MKTSREILNALYLQCGFETSTLDRLDLGCDTPLLSSSFRISDMAQVSLAASASAAAEIYKLRSKATQDYRVGLNAAELECSAFFTINGQEVETWAKYSGLYKCADGYIRVHANFDHHRDCFLQYLGFSPGIQCEKEAVVAAVAKLSADQLEEQVCDLGGIVAKLRNQVEWAEHPQFKAMKNVPPFLMEKISNSECIDFSCLEEVQRPLTGLKVLDLTRILAGPVCTRSLAAYGAEVLTVNGPHLPNIEHIIDTGRGKRSCYLDFRQAKDREHLKALLADADILVQSYRPQSLHRYGFSAEELTAIKPGLIIAELSAFGHLGPWANKRGFDSIVQSSCGMNWAEAEAMGETQPRAFPVQVLDFSSGFLMAFACQMALIKRAREGGSWRIRSSLLQTANWLNSLGRQVALPQQELSLLSSCRRYPSEYGELLAMPHGVFF